MRRDTAIKRLEALAAIEIPSGRLDSLYYAARGFRSFLPL